MNLNKKTLLKTLSWETFHLVGVAGVIYLFTKEWEYASYGALLYIGWEAIGYYIHERAWITIDKKVKTMKKLSPKQKKIASAAKPADKITGDDFKALKKKKKIKK